MPCYSPSSTWTDADGVYLFRSTPFACGNCIGCRLAISQAWAARCLHESQLWPENASVTLTYDDQHVPTSGSLQYPHYQKFMRRLRKRFDQTIRFYMGGEYGEKTLRPHYHAILFNVDFPDKKYHKSGPSGNRLYTSELLAELWGHGNCLTGAVTYESAAYIARYITKKITGPQADQHYNGRTPEFNQMSRKPGIGSQWLHKFKSDVYPHGTIIINSKETTTPQYYDKIYKAEAPGLYEKMKQERTRKTHANQSEQTDERRLARETVKRAQIKQLKRTLD